MNERIIELRKALGMTQEEFATGIGMKRPTLSGIELNKAPITGRTIMLICNKYNVNRKWLIDGVGDMFDIEEHQKNLFLETFRKLKNDEKDFIIKISKKL